MTEEMCEDYRCIISVFLAFRWQEIPLVIKAFAFCLTRRPALNFIAKVSYFSFHPWAHFMNTLVSIDEGHNGFLFTRGGWGGQAKTDERKKSGMRTDPTCGFISLGFALRVCVNVWVPPLRPWLCMQRMRYECWSVHLSEENTRSKA